MYTIISLAFPSEVVTFLDAYDTMQAVGPVALVSLLLSEGLTKVIPGAEVNANPNRPADPAVQKRYNHAAIQVCHRANSWIAD